MIVAEFLASISNFVEFNRTTNYTQRFQQLNSIVSKARNNLGGAWQAEIEAAIKELVDITIKYEISTGFPFDKNPAFEFFGIQDGLGIGNLIILSQLIKNDVIGAEQKVTAISQKLTNHIQHLDNIRNTFQQLGIASYGDYYKRDSDKVIISVKFPSSEDKAYEAKDITKLLDEFDKNLRFFGRIHKKSREAGYKVLTISKSSPVTMEILTYSAVGYAVSKSVNSVLTSIEKVQKIRLLQKQIGELGLKNAAKIDELLEEEQREMQNAENDALQSIMDGSKPEDYEGENPQVGVKKGIKYIQELVVNGGEVNVYLLPTNLPDSDNPEQELIEMKTNAAIGEGIMETKKLDSSNVQTNTGQ